LTAAAEHRRRDAFTVSADYAAPFNQSGSNRTNSDLRQTALLLAGRRSVATQGEAVLTLLATDGEKGVPPETHLADARFWRYPLQRRLLVGGQIDAPLDAHGDWWLGAVASADLFALEIRPYSDAKYSGPPLDEGAEYERNRDATGYLRGRIERRFPEAVSLALQTEARYTRHRETLTVGGPELTYAQWLGGVTAEATLTADTAWRLTVGAGWEFAATPESGDKPDRGTTTAGVLSARLGRRLGLGATAYAGYARRSRFPSLRELYSGALGRFVPNPDLTPERGDQVEVGIDAGGADWEVGVSGFLSHLRDGIERAVLPGDEPRFQRVNRTAVRTYGLELVASWRPLAPLALSGHHTFLHARVRENGSYDRPAEDRPQSLTTLALRWAVTGGWELGVEGFVIGPRQSADTTAPDGLRRLPAQMRGDLRLAWTAYDLLPDVPVLEAFLRLENAFDAVVESQTGLPEPGRTWRGGLRLRLGDS
jgi:iron complex outermembrane receptor protein